MLKKSSSHKIGEVVLSVILVVLTFSMAIGVFFTDLSKTGKASVLPTEDYFDLTDNTLIIYNTNSLGGLELANHYAQARGISTEYICPISVPPGHLATADHVLAARKQIIDNCICPDISLSPCNVDQHMQIREHSPITHLVFMKGIPTLISHTGWFNADKSWADRGGPSFDAYLALSLYNENPFANPSVTEPDHFYGEQFTTTATSPDKQYLRELRASDGTVAWGRVEAMTVQRTKNLIDRTLANERAGLNGKLIATQQGRSLSGIDFLEIFQEFTSEFRQECISPDGELPHDCRMGIDRSGHVPGEPSANIRRLSGASVYAGYSFRGNGHSGFDGFSHMLNWRKTSQECQTLCQGLPESEQGACRARSTDYYQEINTDCVGGSGLIGNQYRSFPVQHMATYPFGWSSEIGVGPYTVPRVIEGDGVKTDVFTDDYFLRYQTDDAVQNPQCATLSGPLESCEEHMSISLGRQMGRFHNNDEYILRFWYRHSANPGQEIKVWLSRRVDHNDWPGSNTETIEIPLDQARSEWTLFEQEFNTRADKAQTILKIRAFSHPSPDHQYKPLTGFVDFDGFEFIHKETGENLLSSSAHNPVEIGSFSTQGKRATSPGDYAFNAIERMGGIAWWGSSSHYQSAGHQLADTPRQLPALFSGRTLGESLLFTAGRGTSGLKYVDPLYRPLGVKIFHTDKLLENGATRGSRYMFNSNPSFNQDVYINAFNGQTSQWSVDICEGTDIQSCTWRQVENGGARVYEHKLASTLLDLVPNQNEDYSFILRLSVFSGGPHNFYDYTFYHYTPNAEFDECYHDIDCSLPSTCKERLDGSLYCTHNSCENYEGEITLTSLQPICSDEDTQTQCVNGRWEDLKSCSEGCIASYCEEDYTHPLRVPTYSNDQVLIRYPVFSTQAEREEFLQSVVANAFLGIDNDPQQQYLHLGDGSWISLTTFQEATPSWDLGQLLEFKQAHFGFDLIGTPPESINSIDISGTSTFFGLPVCASEYTASKLLSEISAIDSSCTQIRLKRSVISKGALFSTSGPQNLVEYDDTDFQIRPYDNLEVICSANTDLTFTPSCEETARSYTILQSARTAISSNSVPVLEYDALIAESEFDNTELRKSSVNTQTSHVILSDLPEGSRSMYLVQKNSDSVLCITENKNLRTKSQILNDCKQITCPGELDDTSCEMFAGYYKVSDENTHAIAELTEIEQEFYCDSDGDSSFSAAVTDTCDQPGCVPNNCQETPGDDCDDTDSTIFPGATEQCDLKDNDCDNSVDENEQGATLSQACYSGPEDTRNIGLCSDGAQLCVNGAWAACSGDTLPSQEICDENNNDENCDGSSNENCQCSDGQTQNCGSDIGMCSFGQQTCADGTWGECVGGQEPSEEICDANGNDENCNGESNENCQCSDGQTQSCGSDVGMCSFGQQTCTNGAWGDCIGGIQPSAEICDGLDNNCNGQSDENLERDSENQEGMCSGNGETCVEGSWIPNQDNHLPTTDICDGEDNNCDGNEDEDYPELGDACSEGLGVCFSSGTMVCSEQGTECSAVAGSPTGADDTCNNINEDCDTQTDEHYVSTPTTCGVGACSGNTGSLICSSGSTVDTCNPFAGSSPESCEDESGYDGIDNNCDGIVDLDCNSFCDVDSDGFTSNPICLLGGFTLGDCDDTNAEINPNAVERCDLIDNDCDDSTLDGSEEEWDGASCDAQDVDQCTDDVFACVEGQQVCVDSEQDLSEQCGDGIDNDCNDLVDESDPACILCESGESRLCENQFGVCESSSQICTEEGNFPGCDYTLIENYEESETLCDGLDNDCDQEIDESLDGTCYSGPEGTLGVGLCSAGSRICSEGSWGECIGEILPQTEVCDGLDNNCDGETDEGLDCAVAVPQSIENFATGEIAQQSIALSWDVVTDESVTEIHLFQFEEHIETLEPTQTTHTVEELVANSDYTFGIDAVSAEGHRSATRATVSTKTLSKPIRTINFHQSILGDNARVETNIEGFSLVVGDGLNTQNLEGKHTVFFMNGQTPILSFTHDFSEGSLESDVILVQDESSLSRAALLIAGLNVSQKDVYFPLVNSTNQSLCVKDANITNITQVSESCTAEGEVYIHAIPSTEPYQTELISDLLVKVSGLRHTAIEQTCTEQWSCSGWSTCSAGSQTRSCTDTNACGTAHVKPSTQQSCTSSAPSRGGGGGGGGGGGSFIRPKQNDTQEEPKEEPEPEPKTPKKDPIKQPEQPKEEPEQKPIEEIKQEEPAQEPVEEIDQSIFNPWYLLLVIVGILLSFEIVRHKHHKTQISSPLMRGARYIYYSAYSGKTEIEIKTALKRSGWTDEEIQQAYLIASKYK